MTDYVAAFVSIMAEVSGQPTPEQLDALHVVIRPRTLLVDKTLFTTCSACRHLVPGDTRTHCENQILFVAGFLPDNFKGHGDDLGPSLTAHEYQERFPTMSYIGTVTGGIGALRIESLNPRWGDFLT